jgi:hypothetical protein
MPLRFSCLAKFDDVSGSAIWNKSPRSVVADQTMKKALIKKAVARLVAC